MVVVVLTFSQIGGVLRRTGQETLDAHRSSLIAVMSSLFRPSMKITLSPSRRRTTAAPPSLALALDLLWPMHDWQRPSINTTRPADTYVRIHSRPTQPEGPDGSLVRPRYETGAR